MSYNQQMPAPYHEHGVQDGRYEMNAPPSSRERAEYAQYVQNQQPTGLESWFHFRNPSYSKGFIVGAGIALVLANPAVQRAMVAGAVKLWSGMQGGVEEIKERVKDIKAEMSTRD